MLSPVVQNFNLGLIFYFIDLLNGGGGTEWRVRLDDGAAPHKHNNEKIYILSDTIFD